MKVDVLYQQRVERVHVADQDLIVLANTTISHDAQVVQQDLQNLRCRRDIA